MNDYRYNKINFLDDMMEEMYMKAIENENMEVIKTIPNNVPYDIIRQCLYKAALEGKEKAVKLLLQEKIDFHVTFSWALIAAASKGFTTIVQMLLQDKRASPKWRNSQCLYMAIFNNHEETVEMLLKDGRVKPNLWDMKDVIVLVKHSNKDLIDLLTPFLR